MKASTVWVQLGLALGVLLVVGLSLVAAATSEVWLSPASPTPTFAPKPVAFFTPVVIEPGQPTPTLFPPTPTLLPNGTLFPTPTFCPPPEGWALVVVSPGETLTTLAQRYHISAEALRQANCLPGDSLPPGSAVYVPLPPTQPPKVTPCGPPAGWVIHIVQQGENLFRLSLAYGVTVAQLQWANCLNGTLIYTGQRLYVPPVAATNTPFDWAPSPTATPSPTTTASPTLSSTATPTIAASVTPTATATLTATSPSPTATPSATLPTPSPTTTPVTPTATATVPTATATLVSPTATSTPVPPTFTPTPSPTP